MVAATEIFAIVVTAIVFFLQMGVGNVNVSALQIVLHGNGMMA